MDVRCIVITLTVIKFTKVNPFAVVDSQRLILFLANYLDIWKDGVSVS